MPILPEEPQISPDTLFEIPISAPDGPGRRWWCCNLMSRTEKAFARALRGSEIPYYLPQRVVKGSTPRGRKISSLVPLFPSYIFIKASTPERWSLLKNKHLIRILEIHDQQEIDEDLRRVQRVLETGLNVTPVPQVREGQMVRIVDGALAGLCGTVLRLESSDRFIANVRFLGTGAAIELSNMQVEVIRQANEPAPDPVSDSILTPMPSPPPRRIRSNNRFPEDHLPRADDDPSKPKHHVGRGSRRS